MPTCTSKVAQHRRSSLQIGSARQLLLPLIFLLVGGVSQWRPAAADADRSPTQDGDETASTAGDLNELSIEIVEKPSECERTSQNGNMLKVHYTGYFANGSEFDTSRGGRNSPFSFVLGGHRVIKGWDLGLVNMCVGEKRRLTVPPHLGYGKEGFGKVIGPNEVLIFDVELVELIDTVDEDGLEPFRFENLDLDEDGVLQRDEIRDYLKKMGDRLEEIAIQMETLQGQNELINRVMEIHDGNDDGVIDKDEFYTPRSSRRQDEL